YDELVELRRMQPLAQRDNPVARITRNGRARFTARQLVVFVLIILLLLVLPATALARAVYFAQSGGPVCVSDKPVIDGSTALQPLTEAAAEKYMQSCSSAHITVGGGASKTGLADVEQGHNVVFGVYPGKDYAQIGGHDVAIQIGDSDIFAQSS